MTLIVNKTEGEMGDEFDYDALTEEDIANLRALTPQEPMAVTYGEDL